MEDFKPDEEMRRKVAIAAGAGMAHEEIAIGLGIEKALLQERFERELSEGAYAKRMEVLDATHAAALKGNATAQRAYLDHAPKAATPPLPKPSADEKPAPIGKKQQANADAKTAACGTDWEDLLPAQPTQ